MKFAYILQNLTKKIKRQNLFAHNTRWAAFWFTSKSLNMIFLSQLLQTTQDVTKKKNRWNSSHKNTKLGEGGGWIRKMADEIL